MSEQAPHAPFPLGDYIDAFVTSTGQRVQAAADEPSQGNNLSAFLSFIETQLCTKGNPMSVYEPLGVPKETYYGWTLGKRPTLAGIDKLGESHGLRANQKVDLWAIIKGDISMGSVKDLIHTAIDDKAPIRRLSTQETRSYRAKLWEMLQRRCGFTDEKMADASGYAAQTIKTLKDGTFMFETPSDARRIAKVFAPENKELQNLLIPMLNGLPRHYTSEELASRIIDNFASTPEILYINRIQKGHSREQAAKQLDMVTQTYKNAEFKVKAISDENEAKAVAGYVGIIPEHALYAPLVAKLMKRPLYTPELLNTSGALAELRVISGLSQGQLGDVIHVTRNIIAKMEAEGLPLRQEYWDYLPRLVQVLRIPVEDRERFVDACAPKMPPVHKQIVVDAASIRTLTTSNTAFIFPANIPPHQFRGRVYDAANEVILEARMEELIGGAKPTDAEWNALATTFGNPANTPGSKITSVSSHVVPSTHQTSDYRLTVKQSLHALYQLKHELDKTWPKNTDPSTIMNTVYTKSKKVIPKPRLTGIIEGEIVPTWNELQAIATTFHNESLQRLIKAEFAKGGTIPNAR